MLIATKRQQLSDAETGISRQLFNLGTLFSCTVLRTFPVPVKGKERRIMVLFDQILLNEAIDYHGNLLSLKEID
jgi:hypothetical protein